MAEITPESIEDQKLLDNLPDLKEELTKNLEGSIAGNRDLMKLVLELTPLRSALIRRLHESGWDYIPENCTWFDLDGYMEEVYLQIFSNLGSNGLSSDVRKIDVIHNWNEDKDRDAKYVLCTKLGIPAEGLKKIYSIIDFMARFEKEVNSRKNDESSEGK
jgi:hypothetical protein